MSAGCRELIAAIPRRWAVWSISPERSEVFTGLMGRAVAPEDGALRAPHKRERRFMKCPGGTG